MQAIVIYRVFFFLLVLKWCKLKKKKKGGAKIKRMWLMFINTLNIITI